MIFAGLAFVAGNCLYLQIPVLLSPAPLAIALPLCLYGLRSAFVRIPAAFVLGCLVTGLEIRDELQYRVPVQPERIEARLIGTVVGLPAETDGISRFLFRVGEGRFEGSRLRLTWYRPPVEIEPGQRWRLNVRVSEPSGHVNFGLFDYERWLFAKRIHGRGYVADWQPLLLDRTAGIDTVRLHIKRKLQQALAPDRLATFFALALGDTSFLDNGHWQVLNKTATTHLLIVSGLHVGLIAAFVFQVLRFAGTGFFTMVWLTIGMTGAYALIAGWGLPVQRAFLMTAVFLLSMLLQRNISLQARFVLALTSVVLFDPLASLSNGFWLSFGAVFALMQGFAHRPAGAPGVKRWFRSTTRAQWVVFLALMPVLGYFNQQLPLGSFLVNLVAIPWVGLVLVPAMLVGLLLLLLAEPVGLVFFPIAGLAADGLWWFLRTASDFNMVSEVSGYDTLVLMAGLLGVAMLLAPRGLTPRWLGLFLVLLVARPPARLDHGDLRLTFLDVGQGLSVLLETSSAASLYDTGPAFGDRFSAARQVVLPSLRRAGWNRLDKLVISHADNDHAGGLADIVESVPVGRVIRRENCAGQWQTDGVGFRVFSVTEGVDSPNDSTCLLSIRVHGRRILLTGDVERRAEEALVAVGHPRVLLMSAPHHGSASSSSPALLNTLRPDLVVVSAGYKNRFSHPHDKVMRRYNNRDIMVLNTAFTGAVEVSIDGHGYRLRTARAGQPGIWRRTGGG